MLTLLGSFSIAPASPTPSIWAPSAAASGRPRTPAAPGPPSPTRASPSAPSAPSPWLRRPQRRLRRHRRVRHPQPALLRHRHVQVHRRRQDLAHIGQQACHPVRMQPHSYDERRGERGGREAGTIRGRVTNPAHCVSSTCAVQSHSSLPPCPADLRVRSGIVGLCRQARTPGVVTAPLPRR